jgi:hypothetical protein
VPDPLPTPDANYSSGNDYIVEFLGYRFSFGGADFEGRVTAAAVKLGVVEAQSSTTTRPPTSSHWRRKE